MSDDITNMQYWTVRAHITGTDGQVVSNRYHRAILDSAEVDRWCDQPLATVGHDGQWIVHDAIDVLFDPQMPRPLSGQLWDVLHTIADQLRVTVPLIALGMDQDAHMQADTGPLTLRNDSAWSITRVDATGGEQRIVTASTHRAGKQYTIDTSCTPWTRRNWPRRCSPVSSWKPSSTPANAAPKTVWSMTSPGAMTLGTS